MLGTTKATISSLSRIKLLNKRTIFRRYRKKSRRKTPPIFTTTRSSSFWSRITSALQSSQWLYPCCLWPVRSSSLSGACWRTSIRALGKSHFSLTGITCWRFSWTCTSCCSFCSAFERSSRARLSLISPATSLYSFSWPSSSCTPMTCHRT